MHSLWGDTLQSRSRGGAIAVTASAPMAAAIIKWKVVYTVCMYVYICWLCMNMYGSSF